MSIYAKLAQARAEFHKRELKKSGKNTFAGYSYFELADFVRPGMDCLRDAGLVPVISFDAAEATMTLHEIEGEGSIMVDDTGVRAGDDAADVSMSASAETFQGIIEGDVNPTMAFMSGKLKIEGDMGMAMKLGSAWS